MGRTSGWQTKAKARMGMVYAVCGTESAVLVCSDAFFCECKSRNENVQYMCIDGKHLRAAVGVVHHHMSVMVAVGVVHCHV